MPSIIAELWSGMLSANDQSKMERAFTGAAKRCCEGGSVNRHALSPVPAGGNLQPAGKTFLGCKLELQLGLVGPRACMEKLHVNSQGD